MMDPMEIWAEQQVNGQLWQFEERAIMIRQYQVKSPLKITRTAAHTQEVSMIELTQVTHEELVAGCPIIHNQIMGTQVEEDTVVGKWLILLNNFQKVTVLNQFTSKVFGILHDCILSIKS